MPETTQVIRIESRKAVTSGAVRAGRRRGTMREGLSWLVAFPTLLLVLPLVRRAVARIVAPL
jgi:hypothetical protein